MQLPKLHVRIQHVLSWHKNMQDIKIYFKNQGDVTDVGMQNA